MGHWQMRNRFFTIKRHFMPSLRFAKARRGTRGTMVVNGVLGNGAIVMMITILGLMGCGSHSLEGQIHTEKSQTLRLETRDQILFMNDGESVLVKFEPKGIWLNSNLLIQTSSQSLKIKIPKSTYLSEDYIEAKAWQTGLNFDLKAFRMSKLVSEVIEEGIQKCNAGGDCGQIEYIYKPDGTAKKLWVPQNCMGTEKVVWKKRIIHQSYRIEFADRGHFQSQPLVHEEKVVIERLSDCVRTKEQDNRSAQH